MTDELNFLLKNKNISRNDYETYIVFECNDAGKKFLKERMTAIVMEEPINPIEELFSWHDGRRSVFRDFKRAIDHVNFELENLKNG